MTKMIARMDGRAGLRPPSSSSPKITDLGTVQVDPKLELGAEVLMLEMLEKLVTLEFVEGSMDPVVGGIIVVVVVIVVPFKIRRRSSRTTDEFAVG